MPIWDALRLVLAKSRAGSIRGAASALAVNHATAFRRVGACEKHLEITLFDRTGKRLELAAAGAEAVAAAEVIDHEVINVERRIAVGDLSLDGTLEDALASSLRSEVADVFALLTQAYAGVELEFATRLELVNFSQRDAYDALRIIGRLSGNLLGKQLGGRVASPRVRRARYERTRDRPIAEWPRIGWHPSALEFKTSRWVMTDLGGICRGPI